MSGQWNKSQWQGGYNKDKNQGDGNGGSGGKWDGPYNGNGGSRGNSSNPVNSIMSSLGDALARQHEEAESPKAFASFKCLLGGNTEKAPAAPAVNATAN